MALKHLEIEPNQDNPFLNCKLDRKKYAVVLTEIIESYPDGFVLAINNKWGTGKTTFVKMWEKYLKNSGYTTIYFNAWENDFEDNPLTAFIGELNIINKKSDDSFNNVVKNAASISKNVAPAILKAVLNRYIDSDTLVEALSETSKSFLDIFQEEVNEYAARKKSITDFKKSLSEFVANKSNGKPLVFIVDELDRCRPNYSVLLLEQIKHFFSVPYIVFILSIDKIQLGNAVCGVYGSEKIDSEEYLKRFIDIEYSIPEPDKGKFFDYLFDYFDYNTFFNSNERRRYNEFENDKENFKKLGKILIGNLTLRQQEKILSHTRIVLRTFKSKNYLLPNIFIFLVYIKTTNHDFYSSLVKKTLNLIEVRDKHYEIIESFITENDKWIFAQTEAYLLRFYEKETEEFRLQSKILDSNSNNLMIKSRIDDNKFKAAYETAFDLELKLSYFIDKLNLVDSIKIN